MSNAITVDSLRGESKAKTEYAPLQLKVGDQVLTLHGLLNVRRNTRREAYGLIKKIGDMADRNPESGKDMGLEETAEAAEYALQLFQAVADNDELGAALITQIEDDVELTMRVFEAWMKTSQPGEAGLSES